MLLYPVYALLFADAGLTTSQISMLFAIWSVVAFAFEVPSGALADLWSRRGLYAVGELLTAAGFASWLLWPAFPGFALGFVLWGLGGALASGTLEALVYDELAAEGRAGDYAKVAGRSGTVAILAMLAATLLAAPAFAAGGYSLVGAASIATVTLGGLLALRLPDPSRTDKAADDHSSRGTLTLPQKPDRAGEAPDDHASGRNPALPRKPNRTGEAPDDRAGGGNPELLRNPDHTGEAPDQRALGRNHALLRNPDHTGVAPDDRASSRNQALPRKPNRTGEAAADRAGSGYLVLLRVGVRESVKSRQMVRVLAVAALLPGFTALDEYLPLLSREKGAPTAAVPLLFGLTALAMAAGSALAGRDRAAGPRLLPAAVAVAAALLAAGALIPHLAGMALVSCAFGLLEFATVRTETRLQETITGPARTTVLSVSGFAAEVFAVGLYAYFALGVPLPPLFAGCAVPLLITAAVASETFTNGSR